MYPSEGHSLGWCLLHYFWLQAGLRFKAGHRDTKSLAICTDYFCPCNKKKENLVNSGLRIGYFRVGPSLCFKTRLSEKRLIWKWSFYSQKVLHLASFWKWEILELGNGLFGYSLRASSPIWASEANLAKTREGGASAPHGFAARLRVLARPVSLAQTGELARRLIWIEFTLI